MKFLIPLLLTLGITGCAKRPPLIVNKPCSIVSVVEDSSGVYVTYVVRCLEYTGPVGVPSGKEAGK